jgi:hypothetical protein
VGSFPARFHLPGTGTPATSQSKFTSDLFHFRLTRAGGFFSGGTERDLRHLVLDASSGSSRRLIRQAHLAKVFHEGLVIGSNGLFGNSGSVSSDRGSIQGIIPGCPSGQHVLR